MLTDDSLRQIMPRLPAEKRPQTLTALEGAMSEFEIDTTLRASAFLAQIAHESSELRFTIENLNYSAKGLMATWPRRFPDIETARLYERNPEKLANYVYANRIGNGDEASGDGWKYRGRGPIQITGRANYAKYGGFIGEDLVKSPENVETPECGLRVAGVFWMKNGLNELADQEMFEEITKKINGGTTGLDDRLKYYDRAKQALGVKRSRRIRTRGSLKIASLPAFTRGREEIAGERREPSAQRRVRATKKSRKVIRKTSRTTQKRRKRGSHSGAK